MADPIPPSQAPAARVRADGSADAALGLRLAALSGRLELLIHHLTGAALARRAEPVDLVQETLLRLLCSAATARAADEGDAALWAFARTMARRVVIDAARAARADPRRFSSLQPDARPGSSASGGAAPEGAAGGPGPATLAAGAESLAVWTRAFRALPPEHRRVLGLRRFEGLSAAETGRRMGRSESAVHSLFRRALEAWEAGIRAV